jgi:hypothetical protein
VGSLATIVGTLDNIRGHRVPNAAMWSIEAAPKNAVDALSRRCHHLPCGFSQPHW